MSTGMHATVAKPSDTATDTDEVKLWGAKASPELAEKQKMLQTISFKLGNFDDENRTFQAIGSTPMVDRQGDSIEQSGWVLDNFIKNPVVPWAHCYNELPVARAIEVGVQDGNLVFTYQAPPEGMYPFADTVYQMYRHQFMFAFSVGFIPLEYEGNWEDGYNFTKCELLEISAVPVPANAGALVLAQKMGVMGDRKAAQSMISKVEDALTQLKKANDIDVPKHKKDLGTIAPVAPEEPRLPETPEAPAENPVKEATDTKVTIVDKDELKAMLGDILKELAAEEAAEVVVADSVEEKGAISSNLPLADKDQTWDKGAAVKAVKDWASNDDGEIDFSKYKKAFMWVNSAAGDKQGDYKLPYATVVDGELKAVWNAVKTIYAVLEGSMGGVDIPEADKASVMTQVKKYYKKFGEGTPGSSDDDSKGLTNNDNMGLNDNMTETKSGAKLSQTSKNKIKAVMDGLESMKSMADEHIKALSDLYNVGADSAGDEAQNDDPDADNDLDGKDKSAKSIETTEVEETKEVVGEAKAAEDKTSEESADLEDKTEKEVTPEVAEETPEKVVEAPVEETEVEAPNKDETEEADEDLIDPDNLSDDDIVKLTAAVQAELEKDNKD